MDTGQHRRNSPSIVRTTRRLSVVAVSVVVLLLLTVSACSSTTSKTTAQPLTSEQAATLADALYLNYQDKGALFTANAAWTSLGRTISLSGEVDWTTTTGHALVRSTGAETGLTEVWWNGDTIVEYWPMLANIAPSLGYADAKFVSRTLDPERRLTDRVISVVNSLAAAERENALLIQQKPGSEFVRTDELQNQPVEVLRYGMRNMYWIELDSNRMVRFDGNAESGTAPVVVNILKVGAQTITPPPIQYIISSDKIRSLYGSLTGS